MSESDYTGVEVAIVGMAGRFPGAKNLDEFWRNVCDGVESLHPLDDRALKALGVDDALVHDPHYVKVGSGLEGMELFDAAFFGYTPREAELMDPQHRIFLECAWEGLEKAGYDPRACQKAIGVFAGGTTNTYLVYNLLSNPALLEALDQMQIDVGNGADFLCTRVSYKLGLRGPSCAIQTACSTSLVAVHMACQSLLQDECDLALAGGVSIHVRHPLGYRYMEGGIVAPDGHCRAFDAAAAGTVFGSGVGVVVLKRLEDALAEGDHIHAVIRGSAVNNDGDAKVGYTAPGVEGQAAVIAEALSVANVAAATIGYVETHGTGTQMGDPIEVRALTRAFRQSTDRRNYCAIGSVKTNIGHLAGAAGVSSLIKAALVVERGRIPPSLHFERPNPEIDFANSPFFVNTRLSEWQADGTPRRAGVSSFGVGGTNAHVVLEQAPTPVPAGPSRPVQLLVLSAKTETALEALTDNLAGYLGQHPESALADVAHTLHTGRQGQMHRRVVLARDRESAVKALEARSPHCVFDGTPETQKRPVAFMFPGQGAQYVNMALGLYQTEPAFRAGIDICAELLRPHLQRDVRQVFYPQADQVAKAARLLDETEITQAALFAVEYALAQVWMAWGVHPQAMIGHSIGEYVAACLAGVFALEDGLALVAARGRAIQSLPEGAMLAVSLPAEETQPFLSPDLSIAAVNAPTLTVVSGPPPAVESLRGQLAEREIACRRLHVSHAFHSALMEPLVAAFAGRVGQVSLHAPRIPYISNVSGTWIKAEEATDPDYWARHLRQTVRFSDGVRELLQEPARVLLEVGPGDTLTRLAKRHVEDGKTAAVFPSLRHPREEGKADDEFLLAALGRLWLAGVDVDWSGFYAGERRRRVPLPTYPFERQRYWIEPGNPVSVDSPSQHRKDAAEWFYLPVWQTTRLPRPFAQAANDLADDAPWLIMADAHDLGAAMARHLRAAGQNVIVVQAGKEFAAVGGETYTVNPSQPDDYGALFRELGALRKVPGNVIHLWSIVPDEDQDNLSAAERFRQAQEAGFYSLLFLAQAFTPFAGGGRRMWVVSSHVHKVESGDRVYPERATILGLCRTIPHEYPGMVCRYIDADWPGVNAEPAARLSEQLLAEIAAQAPERIVAYRGEQRWAQHFEPIQLDGAGSVGSLKKKGVYLIADGLSNVGLAIASLLARTAQAQLILVQTAGASLPSPAGWTRHLESGEADGDIGRKLRQVVALEESGAQVLVVRADRGDPEQMQDALVGAIAQCGALDGFVFTAGDVKAGSFQTIQEMERGHVERLFEQIPTLLALQEIVSGQPASLCLLVASLTSVLGGLGQAGHAALSLYLDAFASGQGGAWLSVDWDAWQFDTDKEAAATLPAQWTRFALSPAEGQEALKRILSAFVGHRIVVSTGDLKSRIEQGERAARSRAREDETVQERHARPQLATAYVAPRNTIEQCIVDVWQQTLGIEPIGIDDNFFELGGDSLIAVGVIARLEKALHKKVATATLYQRSTVRRLAELLSQDEAQAAQKGAGAFAERKAALGRRNQYLHQRTRKGRVK